MTQNRSVYSHEIKSASLHTHSVFKGMQDEEHLYFCSARCLLLTSASPTNTSSSSCFSFLSLFCHVSLIVQVSNSVLLAKRKFLSLSLPLFSCRPSPFALIMIIKHPGHSHLHPHLAFDLLYSLLISA